MSRKKELVNVKEEDDLGREDRGARVRVLLMPLLKIMK